MKNNFIDDYEKVYFTLIKLGYNKYELDDNIMEAYLLADKYYNETSLFTTFWINITKQQFSHKSKKKCPIRESIFLDFDIPDIIYEDDEETMIKLSIIDELMEDSYFYELLRDSYISDFTDKEISNKYNKNINMVKTIKYRFRQSCIKLYSKVEKNENLRFIYINKNK